MSHNHDFVSDLPPREPTGRGRDKLFGSIDGERVGSWDDPVTESVDMSTVKIPFQPFNMAGLCRTCGKGISSQRFFDNGGKCFGC